MKVNMRIGTRILAGYGLALVVVGAALGAWGAHLSRRLFQGLLFGIDPSDEGATALAAALLLATALLASFLPARRAARIDPMAALRQE